MRTTNWEGGGMGVRNGKRDERFQAVLECCVFRMLCMKNFLNKD